MPGRLRLGGAGTRFAGGRLAHLPCHGGRPESFQPEGCPAWQWAGGRIGGGLRGRSGRAHGAGAGGVQSAHRSQCGDDRRALGIHGDSGIQVMGRALQQPPAGRTGTTPQGRGRDLWAAVGHGRHIGGHLARSPGNRLAAGPGGFCLAPGQPAAQHCGDPARADHHQRHLPAGHVARS